MRLRIGYFRKNKKCQKATVTSNVLEVSNLPSNHEDLGARIVLNALDATAVGYERNVGKCRDTDQGIRCVYIVTVSPLGLQY